MRALKELFGSAANGATVGEVVRDVFGVEYDDDRAARALNEQQISGLRLDELCPPVRTVGTIGEGAFGGQYRRVQDVTRIGDAEIPFAIEVWCGAERVEKDAATLSVLFSDHQPLAGSGTNLFYGRQCRVARARLWARLQGAGGQARGIQHRAQSDLALPSADR